MNVRLAQLPRRRAAWWGEGRALMALAGPMVVTQLAQMAVLTTDVVMLGRLDTESLAGSALGMTVYYFTFLFCMGQATAVSPMLAYIRGANPHDKDTIRAVVRMGLWIVLLMTLPLIVILGFTRDILLVFGQQADLAANAGRFVDALRFGLPFALGFQVLRNFAATLQRPKAPFYVMAATIGFNALIDYALIFGHFGCPRLGLFGSGLASACSLTFSFLAMAGVIWASPLLRGYHLLRHFFTPNWDKFRELFRLGIPIGLTMIFEVALFNAATLLMGTFGTASVAAHQVAMNVSTITYMVPLGIAMAATVRVGLAAGAGDRAGVQRAGYTAFSLSIAAMGICSAVIALFPHQIARLYFSSASAADADVLRLATIFLRIAAAYQIFDGIQVTAALVLRGLKDAQAPMWIAAGSYWLIGFPACVVMSIVMGLQGVGVWLGLAFALFVAALLLSGRFYVLSRR